MSVRARVYRGGIGWEWRCLACKDFGGGAVVWSSALYGANLHLEHHAKGYYYPNVHTNGYSWLGALSRWAFPERGSGSRLSESNRRPIHYE